ncbi:unnamed protein product, partial [Linum tenue]
LRQRCGLLLQQRPLLGPRLRSPILRPPVPAPTLASTAVGANASTPAIPVVTHLPPPIKSPSPATINMSTSWSPLVGYSSVWIPQLMADAGPLLLDPFPLPISPIHRRQGFEISKRKPHDVSRIRPASLLLKVGISRSSVGETQQVSKAIDCPQFAGGGAKLLRWETPMSVLAFTPVVLRTPTSVKASFPCQPRPKFRTSVSLAAAPATQIGFSDPFVLQLAETLEDSHSPSPLPSLQNLRDTSSESLLSSPWPSRRDEAFRFTDTSLIRQSQILPVTQPPKVGNLATGSEDTNFSHLFIADGFLVNSIPCASSLPDGVFIGSLSSDSSDGIREKLSSLFSDFQWGDMFWSLNGLGAPDVTVIYVPAGVRVETPIHLKYLSVEGREGGSKVLPLSNPRVFVVVEDGGEIGIIEEFVSSEGNENKCYWSNSVLEVVIGKGAKVKHSYVQNQSFNSAHIKWTSVRQVQYLFFTHIYATVLIGLNYAVCLMEKFVISPLFD